MARSRKTSASKTCRVLVVDDSSLMRRVIADILRASPRLDIAGEARDGLEALAQVAALAPDLVLLDIEMPRMDGLEFLAEARLRVAAPVIVLSSVVQAGSPASLQALALGAADVLPKPSGTLSLDLEEKRGRDLLAAIHHCCGLAEPTSGRQNA